jgi:hypothetical protein
MLKLPCEMFAQEPLDIRSSNGGLKELVRNRESLPIFVVNDVYNAGCQCLNDRTGATLRVREMHD